jgi:hypothetical protein
VSSSGQSQSPDESYTPNSIVGNVVIGISEDEVAPLNTVAVFVDVSCPQCGCFLASLERNRFNRSYC